MRSLQTSLLCIFRKKMLIDCTEIILADQRWQRNPDYSCVSSLNCLTQFSYKLCGSYVTVLQKYLAKNPVCNGDAQKEIT